jgi:hypothetical protein
METEPAGGLRQSLAVSLKKGVRVHGAPFSRAWYRSTAAAVILQSTSRKARGCAKTVKTLHADG